MRLKLLNNYINYKQTLHKNLVKTKQKENLYYYLFDSSIMNIYIKFLIT